ncbi:MAG TPA: PspC domain-containing protein [Gemmatimonadaceae bacterium]|nr:PspC domain-containing protein [Gemmatimonadaceae bacterium]
MSQDLRRPLKRSTNERMIAGVVGGLAEYFSIDPTLARVGYVVISLVSAAVPGILLYAILWLLIPEQGS